MTTEAPPRPSPERTGAPLVDPRLRARRIAVRRAERRRWIVAAVVVAALLALAGLAWALAHSPLLSVARVDVVGAQFTGPDVIRAAAGDLQGDALLTADLDGARRALEALPWVESARVERRWPRAVGITVTERTPSASLLQADGTWAIVDGGGQVLAVTPAQPAGLVPVVAAGPVVASGNRIDGWRALAVDAAGRLGPSLTARVAQVGLDPAGGVAVVLRDGGSIWLGNPTDLATKQLAALAVLTGLGEAPVGIVDVRAPGAPVHRVPAPPPAADPAVDPLTPIP